MPISKLMTYDIGNLRYRIPDIEVLYLRYHRSPKITYDIVVFIRYRTSTISYKTTISGVARFQMGLAVVAASRARGPGTVWLGAEWA